MADHAASITLFANSIGAYFSICSLDETFVDRALFVSPVAETIRRIEMAPRAGYKLILPMSDSFFGGLCGAIDIHRLKCERGKTTQWEIIMGTLDIEEFARALEEEKGTELFFDSVKGNVIALDKNVLKQSRKAPKEADEPYRTFLSSRKRFMKIQMPARILKEAMMAFVLTHSAIFAFNDFDMPFSSFSAILREHHLAEEWRMTIKTFVAPYFHRFALEHHYEEKEADESLYLSIAKELRTLKNSSYWQAISLNVFFEVFLPAERFQFCFANDGNQSNRAIFFFLDDEEGGTIRYIQAINEYGIDINTFFSLSSIASFYLNDDPSTNPLFENPYQDCSLSSIYTSRGIRYGNYLLESLALRILSFCKAVNERLPRYFSRHKEEISGSANGIVTLPKDEELSYFEPYEGLNTIPDSPFYDFSLDDLHTPKDLIFVDTSFDMSIRALNVPLVSQEEKRESRTIFAFLLTLHKSGELIYTHLTPADRWSAFSSLTEEMEKGISSILFAHTIYVNNLLDHMFLLYYLGEYIENGSIKIKVTNKNLKRIEEEIEKMNSDMEMIVSGNQGIWSA